MPKSMTSPNDLISPGPTSNIRPDREERKRREKEKKDSAKLAPDGDPSSSSPSSSSSSDSDDDDRKKRKKKKEKKKKKKSSKKKKKSSKRRHDSSDSEDEPLFSKPIIDNNAKSKPLNHNANPRTVKIWKSDFETYFLSSTIGNLRTEQQLGYFCACLDSELKNAIHDLQTPYESKLPIYREKNDDLSLMDLLDDTSKQTTPCTSEEQISPTSEKQLTRKTQSSQQYISKLARPQTCWDGSPTTHAQTAPACTRSTQQTAQPS